MTDESSFQNDTDILCPWWINSKKHKYNFWEYIKANSLPDGSIKEHSQTEISNLFGWSSVKANFVIKDSLEKFIKALETQNAKSLLSVDPEDIMEYLTYNLEFNDSTNTEE